MGYSACGLATDGEKVNRRWDIGTMAKMGNSAMCNSNYYFLRDTIGTYYYGRAVV